MGLPQAKQNETIEETVDLCLSLFSAIGADISITDIDIAHRVPSRNNRHAVKPIICKFTRRSARANVMAKRRETRSVRSSDVNLPDSYTLGNIAIYDHLTPQTQLLHHEAKKF